MRSFDVAHGVRLLPTMSSIPPERAHAVVVVVVVVVVQVARRRDAKKDTTHSLNYCRSLVLQAMDMYLTSVTILDQYAVDLSFRRSSSMESSM